ncbi:MAG: aldehyde ferredoxin oxidoreductase family protein [Dehalococcoidales bacterium]|nr:aldehyde ferredoxin oxidoreductase family protein [Dehalococcoidales bacterium]
MANKIPGGYNGKILRVNLTENTTSVEEIDEKFCRKYIGGAGFIAYYLYKELKPGIDPLGPDNKLIFALGPLAGISIAGSARNCIGSKSPNGNIVKAEAGGDWSVELKRAGFDGIIVDGKAAKPVYLWIENGEVTIKDAGHLWGMQTRETQNTLRKELDDNKIQVAMIGPAGENLVQFSCIMNGLYDAAGRGGVGAVMGSKNLKAIAVRGTHRPKVVSPEGIKEARAWLIENKDLWAAMAEGGTGGHGAAIEMAVTSGNVSVNNFREGIFPNSAEIDAASLKLKMDGCYACPIRCKKVLEVKEPYVVDPAYGGPEYETIGSLGTNCGIGDIKAITKGNEICNADGLDTISAGMVVSFAMECYENGLLTKEDTGGIDLKFGNADAMIKTLELISKREGIGNLLAEGATKAGGKIGKDAGKFSMEVKGIGIPMHEPRLKQALGLGYMVNPHGADHMTNMHDVALTMEGRGLDQYKPLMGTITPIPLEDLGPLKIALLRITMLVRIIQDSLVLCNFIPFPHKKMADITGAITGWDTDIMELLRVAERITTLFRLINIREGLTAEDDKLPDRFFQGKSGALAEKPLDPTKMEEAKSYYYTLMGWDPKTGVPLKEKVAELEIDA